MFALYANESGRILQYQSNDLHPDGMGVIDVGGDTTKVADMYFVSDGYLMQRPTLPKIPTTGTRPMTIKLDVFAKGSTVTISDSFDRSMTMTDLSDPLRLIDVGEYTLTVEQPFPHQNMTQKIEVSNA